jgi:Rod binding domain-containing protein
MQVDRAPPPLQSGHSIGTWVNCAFYHLGFNPSLQPSNAIVFRPFLPTPSKFFPVVFSSANSITLIINALRFGTGIALSFGKGLFMAFTPIQTSAGGDQQATLQLLHEAKAQKVAQEFESIFTTMMLRSMRGSNEMFENDFMPNSLGEKIYTEMLDDEYGKIMSQNSRFGLAKLVLQQIHKNDDAAVPSLEMLAGLKLQSWMIDNKVLPTSDSKIDARDAVDKISNYDALIRQASDQYGVDSNLISAVILQESGGNPNAVSPKGAKGLMQLMDSTSREMGLRQVFNPQQNILAGTKYLSQMLERFDGDETLALASYNAGPAAVEQYRGVPPYDETQKYVASVLRMKDTLDHTQTIPKVKP